MQEVLQSLPTTLNETYSRIVTSLPKAYLQKARRLLQFLVFSERPLRIDEAVDVLAVDSTQQPRFCPKNRIAKPEEITAYCGSFVIIVRQDDNEKEAKSELQLAHFSVKEYFLSSEVEDTFAEALQEANARAVIAETCLIYLLELDASQDVWRLHDAYFLSQFAAMYWASHVSRKITTVEPSLDLQWSSLPVRVSTEYALSYTTLITEVATPNQRMKYIVHYIMHHLVDYIVVYKKW